MSNQNISSWGQSLSSVIWPLRCEKKLCKLLFSLASWEWATSLIRALVLTAQLLWRHNCQKRKLPNNNWKDKKLWTVYFILSYKWHLHKKNGEDYKRLKEWIYLVEGFVVSVVVVGYWTLRTVVKLNYQSSISKSSFGLSNVKNSYCCFCLKCIIHVCRKHRS